MRFRGLRPAFFISGMLGPALFGQTAEPPRFRLEPAPPVFMPGVADSNSPGYWHDGSFYLFTSSGNPVRTEGPNPLEMGAARAVLFYDYTRPLRWIESTWLDDDGTLYAWYHHEVGVCAAGELSVPEIGALVSRDGGATFFDLGAVLASPDYPDCAAANGYFAGGHGDFTVILDRERQYFYFLYGNYGGPPGRQGVAVARMAFADRADPVGRVWKWGGERWDQPGLGGEAAPIFPVSVSWTSPNTDAYWGPSAHWNTHLQRYVMLLNRSCCAPGWPQEGVYLSFTADLAAPASWSAPVKLLDGGNWYPQVLGIEEGESDKLAGASPRLYVGGYSEWYLVFGDGAAAPTLRAPSGTPSCGSCGRAARGGRRRK